MSANKYEGLSTVDIGRPRDGSSKFVVVYTAHPDDEGMGITGTLVDHVKHGDTVKILHATSGGIGGNLPEAEMEFLREREARAYARVLGIPEQDDFGNDNVIFLRFPDGKVANYGDLLVPAITLFLATNPVTDVYYPQFPDYHPDHTALSGFVRRALKDVKKKDKLPAGVAPRRVTNQWEYETSLARTMPPEKLDLVNPITQFWSIKVNAVSKYASQVLDGPMDHIKDIETLNSYRARRARAGEYGEAIHIHRRGRLPKRRRQVSSISALVTHA
jgi:LmbE family N-acetylglucosaminyl deacetylase